MNQVDLFSLLGWGSKIEIERHRRIRLCLWAYAYEIKNTPLVSDGEFDRECHRSYTTVQTGRFDDWWRQNFKPSTGMWIYSHPDLAGIERIYEQNHEE